jgi:hypothetical protein
MKKPQLHVKQAGASPAQQAAMFYRRALGVQVIRHVELAQGLCAMNDLAPPGAREQPPLVEMIRGNPRNGCHLAYVVPDVGAACRRLLANGAELCGRAPEGGVTRICSPAGIPAELIQGSAFVSSVSTDSQAARS